MADPVRPAADLEQTQRDLIFEREQANRLYQEKCEELRQAEVALSFFTRDGDRDYAPNYQDAYQAAWHREAAALEAAREALRQADREASIAHDAIWDKSVAPNELLHDNDNPLSAQSAIWRLHGVVRSALAAGSLHVAGSRAAEHARALRFIVATADDPSYATPMDAYEAVLEKARAALAAGSVAPPHGDDA